MFGRGAFTQVGKDELSTFKPKLIHSLLRANLPALQNCSLSLGGQERILGELFENEVFNSYYIMSSEQFNQIKGVFRAEFDPCTTKPVEKKFDTSNFKELQTKNNNELFKLAARELLENGEITTDEEYL